MTGCTLLGYAIGNAAIPRPQSFSRQNARAIRRGTEVEVFYQLGPNERAPLAGAGSVEEAELSVATGAYAGIEGDKLVLEHSVGPAAVASHETFDLNEPEAVEAVRIVVPLEQVSLIRTKPSPTPAVVGTVVGAAVDVAVVVFWARAARNIQ